MSSNYINNNQAILCKLIVWYHILSHGAIFFADYTQYVELLDFVTRIDGSPSDPHNLLPLELIYAGITAMSFGTVMFGYLLPYFGVGNFEMAAAISAWFHSIWFFHMIWRWSTWNAMMHPDGALTPRFFLSGHIGLDFVFFAVVLLREIQQNETRVASHPQPAAPENIVFSLGTYLYSISIYAISVNGGRPELYISVV